MAEKLAGLGRRIREMADEATFAYGTVRVQTLPTDDPSEVQVTLRAPCRCGEMVEVDGLDLDRLSEAVAAHCGMLTTARPSGKMTPSE